MSPDELKNKINEFLQFHKEYIRNDVADIIGTEAVKHFRQSFVNEGFTDETLEKWPDVKRRDSESPWYGFQLGSNSAKPQKYDENGKKIKARESKAKATNFSPARTKDRILTGETLELQNSISYEKKSDRVTIRSDKPYSQVHNSGELAKVFGKTSFTMPVRKFIGNAKVLRLSIYNKANKDIQKKREQLGL